MYYPIRRLSRCVTLFAKVPVVACFMVRRRCQRHHAIAGRATPGRSPDPLCDYRLRNDNIVVRRAATSATSIILPHRAAVWTPVDGRCRHPRNIPRAGPAAFMVIDAAWARRVVAAVRRETRGWLGQPVALLGLGARVLAQHSIDTRPPPFAVASVFTWPRFRAAVRRGPGQRTCAIYGAPLIVSALTSGDRDA